MGAHDWFRRIGHSGIGRAAGCEWPGFAPAFSVWRFGGDGGTERIPRFATRHAPASVGALSVEPFTVDRRLVPMLPERRAERIWSTLSAVVGGDLQTSSTEVALSLLDAFPRVRLGHLPTPLEPLPRLSAELGGPEIWVKRDDCTGLGMGGNKVRKLEYLLGEAQAEGMETVITVGGVQSNHARQTAAAAARLGLRCELVLPRVVPRSGIDYERGGNILLDELFGAEVFVVDDELAAATMIQRRIEAANERGERAVVHPPGGSTPIGALGYVRAALECLAQIAQIDAVRGGFERIYVAVGTGGTLAGLVCGFQLAGRSIPIRGVCVSQPANPQRDAAAALAGDLCALLGQPPLPAAALDLTDRFLGDGYGVPSAAGIRAITRCARSEGLLLDPVYTSKAMAALLCDAENGTLGDGPVLFWHTGGAPALFAYRSELTSDRQA